MIRSAIIKHTRCDGSLKQVHATEVFMHCPECDQVVSTLAAYDIHGDIVYRLVDSHYIDKPLESFFSQQTRHRKQRRKKPPYQTYVPVEKTS